MKKVEAKELFLKNHYWANIYDGARENVKKWYDVTFYYSMSGRGRKDLAKIEAEFTKEDWENLINSTTNKMAKAEYTKRMSGGGTGGTEILNPECTG